MLRRESGSAGWFSFFEQKALAANHSLAPGQPPSLHTHAALSAHALRGAAPARQWVRGRRGSPARGPLPIPGPKESARRGTERSEAGSPQWGRCEPRPRDGEERVQLRRLPHRGPAPDLRVLTSTMAKRSSSSPGSGIGSFNGTLCALKSVCCESMLPALPMSTACRRPGWLPVPRVRVRNAHSPGRSAPALCGVLASVPLTPLPSRAPSPAGPRLPSCSPPPRRRPGLCASRRVCRALGADPHGAPAAPAGVRGRSCAPALRPPSPGHSRVNTSTLAPPRADDRAPRADTMPPLGPRPRPGSSHPPRSLPGLVVSAQTGHAQKLRALLESRAVVELFAATSWTQ